MVMCRATGILAGTLVYLFSKATLSFVTSKAMSKASFMRHLRQCIRFQRQRPVGKRLTLVEFRHGIFVRGLNLMPNVHCMRQQPRQ